MNEIDYSTVRNNIMKVFYNITTKNNVLEQYFSRDDMIRILEERVKTVTEDMNFFNHFGEWNREEEKLSLKPEIIEALMSTNNIGKQVQVIIMQQLFNVIVDRGDEGGLDKYHFFKDSSKRNGKILSEGMSMALAEKAVGAKTNGLQTEKSIYNILSIIYGDEAFLSDYVKGTNKVEEEISKKSLQDGTIEEKTETDLQFYKLIVCNLDVMKQTQDDIELYEAKPSKKAELEKLNKDKAKYEQVLDKLIERLIKRHMKRIPEIYYSYKYAFLSTVKSFNYKDKIGNLEIQKLLDTLLKKALSTEGIEDKNQKDIAVATSQVTKRGILNQTKTISEAAKKQIIEQEIKENKNIDIQGIQNNIQR